MKKNKDIGVVGTVDTGKALLKAIEIAKEKEREIVIVGLGAEKMIIDNNNELEFKKNNVDQLIEIIKQEDFERNAIRFKPKPSKRDKYKKKFHK